MIQFSIQKGNNKKGNHIQLKNHSVLFTNLPYLLEFIQMHSNQKLEQKLETALEVFPFQDGEIYLLNNIGRNRNLHIEDIVSVLDKYTKDNMVKKEWINHILQKNVEFINKWVNLLSFEPFGKFIKEVSEEDRSYEFVANIDEEVLFLYHLGNKVFEIPFYRIRNEKKEELTYKIYRQYVMFPLSLTE